jgi:glyoxylase-like metal-dependent hydrolase (beta-lactamase superfamily II)
VRRFVGRFIRVKQAVSDAKTYVGTDMNTIDQIDRLLDDALDECGVSTLGHTPGHTSYLLSSAGQNFLFTGDSVTNTAISFNHPNWAFNFDADPVMASETRKRVLDMAMQDKLTLIGYHFAFPGIGNVAKEGDCYRFVPAAMDI